MDWSNERYVRVYTRDTTAMRLMAWDELCPFWELLRKVDRAGVLDLEGHGVRGLAAHLRTPLDVTTRALAAWVAAGWVEVQGDDRLVVPTHLAAQEATASDAARARASRERRRAAAMAVTPGHEPSRAVTNCDATVTPCDAIVTNRDATVTPRHTASHAVTPSVPSVPSVPEEDPPHSPPHQPAPPTASPDVGPSPSKTKKGHRLPDDWTPPADIYAWARTTNAVRLDREQVDQALAEFRDYWRSTPGQKGCKLDWLATFRNRLREVRRRNPRLPEPGPEVHVPPPALPPPHPDVLRRAAELDAMAARGEALPVLGDLIARIGRPTWADEPSEEAPPG